ncbi:11S globulin seed storage protein Ana o 2.0101-like [Primulina eburnea]|uniref:11S globulin seed storage protein Ana o 2.0101-like n=1 Tax=Primulina eburnea TaxID=1245227 RepID=UPI003C6CBD26
MANSLMLPLSLVLMFLFHGCIAQLELPQRQFWQNLQEQQQHRLRAKTQCRIERLNAREPNRKYDCEAGSYEIWDSNSEEFECAGIEFVRYVIQPKGLFLPHYTNAPQLFYATEGSGIHGVVFPGCAETFESGSSFSSEGSESKYHRDRHQKLRRFRKGDVLAMPQALTYWIYNDRDTPITLVALVDVGNDNNQLDLQFRKFFLAGNPQASQSQGEYRQSRKSREHGSQGGRGREEEQEKGNIFAGFDQDLLAEAFDVDTQTIRKLQAREDNRGVIVRAEKLRLVLPEFEEERGGGGEHGSGRYNGLEETFCSVKIRENIDHPARADVYNPRGGRLSTVNSHSLPILSYLRLSAQKGVLYKNAIMTPHWSANSHSAMYVTRGSARIQVVGNGRRVFDENVNQGQLLVVPQNFVVIKKASNEGFEWITFKTNDNAISNQLAGRLSAIRAMPIDVLTNAYRISRDDATDLKYKREEAILFSPGSRSPEYDA